MSKKNKSCFNKIIMNKKEFIKNIEKIDLSKLNKVWDVFELKLVIHKILLEEKKSKNLNNLKK